MLSRVRGWVVVPGTVPAGRVHSYVSTERSRDEGRQRARSYSTALWRRCSWNPLVYVGARRRTVTGLVRVSPGLGEDVQAGAPHPSLRDETVKRSLSLLVSLTLNDFEERTVSLRTGPPPCTGQTDGLGGPRSYTFQVERPKSVVGWPFSRHALIFPASPHTGSPARDFSAPFLGPGRGL